MRELDLLFVPFITEGFDALSESEKEIYEELLEEEDQDLYSWLLGSCIPDRIEYGLLISKILENRKN
jgi:antitoxin CptB